MKKQEKTVVSLELIKTQKLEAEERLHEEGKKLADKAKEALFESISEAVNSGHGLVCLIIAPDDVTINSNIKGTRLHSALSEAQQMSLEMIRAERELRGRKPPADS